MSPAAIGWMEVRLRGWPEPAKRSPMAASTASGQPRPLEELTVSVAPSGTSAAASIAARTLGRAMGSTSHPDRDRTAAGRGVTHRQGRRQGPQAVLAGSGGVAPPPPPPRGQAPPPGAELFLRTPQPPPPPGGGRGT